MTTTDDDLTDLGSEGRHLEDPRTDIEALCLCALLWAPAAGVTAATLQRRAFAAATAGTGAELFALLADQVRAGRPHDPATLAAALTDTGQAGGHHGTQLTRALARATAAGAFPEAAGHYALAVATAAYRRGFHAAATSLTQAAQQLPHLRPVRPPAHHRPRTTHRHHPPAAAPRRSRPPPASSVGDRPPLRDVDEPRAVRAPRTVRRSAYGTVAATWPLGSRGASEAVR